MVQTHPDAYLVSPFFVLTPLSLNFCVHIPFFIRYSFLFKFVELLVICRMLLVRLQSVLEAGAFIRIRNSVIEIMFGDVDKRLKVLSVFLCNSEQRRFNVAQSCNFHTALPQRFGIFISFCRKKFMKCCTTKVTNVVWSVCTYRHFSNMMRLMQFFNFLYSHFVGICVLGLVSFSIFVCTCK